MALWDRIVNHPESKAAVEPCVLNRNTFPDGSSALRGEDRDTCSVAEALPKAGRKALVEVTLVFGVDVSTRPTELFHATMGLKGIQWESPT